MKRISFCFTLCLLFASAFCQAPTQARFDSLVNAYERLGFSGNVLIAHKNKIVYQASYGIANRQTGAKVTPSSLFKIESLGKMLTASLVLQLVEEGRLQLNVPISTYLPDSLYGLPMTNTVTVHHLLTHTSGYEVAPGIGDTGKRMNNVRLSFPQPGSKMLYSNTGYAVLGEIISRVTGESYEENLKKRILKPAGITKFVLNNSNGNLPDMALPYKFYSKTKYRLVTENLAVAGNPAGGGLASIDDLFLFSKAYLNHKYFSPATWKIIRTANHTVTPMPVKNEQFTYGLNWLPSGWIGNHVIYGHSGGGLCYSSALYFDPATDYTVITLSNTYQPSRVPVSNFFNIINNEPLLPVTMSAEYKLMTAIDSIGMEVFKQDFKRQISTVTGTDKPTRTILTALLDNYSDLQLYDAMLAITDIAFYYYPESKALWYYFKASAHYAAKDKPAARNDIELAKSALMEKNEEMVKRYVDELDSKLANEK
jgi:CubicO group peptidase (beta-lactamase class C family)